jgi:hypothetical protein
MTETDVRAATESWLAENRMREVQNYISRGRSRALETLAQAMRRQGYRDL